MKLNNGAGPGSTVKVAGLPLNLDSLNVDLEREHAAGCGEDLTIDPRAAS